MLSLAIGDSVDARAAASLTAPFGACARNGRAL